MAGGAGEIGRGRKGSHREIAKPPVFSGEAGKILGFVTACKLYIKARIMEATVEEQVQWVLSFVQKESANIWKENVLEDLKKEVLEYKSVEKFLAIIKKEFGGGDKESVKVVELKKMEQEGRIMEEFVQKFKRAVRGSEYEGRPLIEEFKREINRGIRRKLMETERPPTSIGQWYKRAIVLNRNRRESKRKEKRLKEQQKAPVPR